MYAHCHEVKKRNLHENSVDMSVCVTWVGAYDWEGFYDDKHLAGAIVSQWEIRHETAIEMLTIGNVMRCDSFCKFQFQQNLCRAASTWINLNISFAICQTVCRMRVALSPS